MNDAALRVPGAKSRWAAVAAIAATYFYFLLFAEFAFLEHASTAAATAGKLRLVMLGLGLGGISGAIGGAILFRAVHARTWLAWAFRACGLSAGVTLLGRNFLALECAGVLSGVSLGVLTVVLASTLRGAVGSARLGLGIGMGTGVAYALCNVPPIFHASATQQTLLVAVIVLAASALPRWMEVSTGKVTEPSRDAPFAVARYVLILLALVWLDSAAFYVIQHTPGLRTLTWDQPRTLWVNALIHFVAALVAGAWLDRRNRTAVLALGMAGLALAGFVLNGALPAVVSAHLFYTAGVSFYSVALVELPARTGRPGIVALVFAVAGWGGSAFGIGMAENLATIPSAFVIVAVSVVSLALLWRTRAARSIAVLVAVFIGVAHASEADVGREVYIAEGCIHCHSQYIRPRVASEVLNWGPATPLRDALAAKPPLFGTRRQGPDLSHVGNRRTAEWNRLHLIAPQTVSPGSRMPSYAHLFSPGDTRGNALLTYLASLGAGTLEARQQQIAAWQPDPHEEISSERAARLFTQLCSQCHGASGRGDGALAAQLSVRPPDWKRDPWRNVRPEDNQEAALTRIIKFGLPGRPMAGHEYLPDAEIVGLAHHVQTLHTVAGSVRVAAGQR